jgi:hypothetical protein
VADDLTEAARRWQTEGWAHVDGRVSDAGIDAELT